MTNMMQSITFEQTDSGKFVRVNEVDTEIPWGEDDVSDEEVVTKAIIWYRGFIAGLEAAADGEKEVEPDYPSTVSLTADGYTWECPRCEMQNCTNEVETEVSCEGCGTVFGISKIFHNGILDYGMDIKLTELTKQF